MSNENEQVPPQGRRGRGCFFYGCLVSLVVVVLLGVGLYWGTRHIIAKFVADYTETQPMKLPQVQMSAAAQRSLQVQVGVFGKALEAGQPIAPLELSGDDVNELIASASDLQWLHHKIYLSFDGDQIKSQVSLPLGEPPLNRFPFAQARGRYFNGTATFIVSFTNQALALKLRSLTVKGRSVPAEVLSQFKSEYISQALYRDPKIAGFLHKLKSIRVQDGKLILVPNVSTNAPPTGVSTNGVSTNATGG